MRFMMLVKSAENGAFPEAVALGSDPSAVQLDEIADDRKTESEAAVNSGR